MLKKYNWHSLSKNEVLKILKTDENKGLNSEEVEKRKKLFGKNKFSEEKEKFFKLKLFFSQFKSPLIYLLLFSALITLFLKKWQDSIVIFFAVLVNGIFGFLEENKTNNTLKKLKKILVSKATVIRNGKIQKILQEDLVPGDIILMKAGDKIPADARLIQTINFRVSQAILTGEWIPSEKNIRKLPPDTQLGDRENMVYMGCLVESGQAKGVVTAIGRKTETGRIFSLLKETKERPTPLQKKIAHFSKIIGIIISIIVVFIFIGGIMRNTNPLLMFEAAVAISVGAIPEALPIVITVILAIGAERILRKNGLIKKLSCVEGLGSAQVVCFDKTRTLTKGKMELSEIISEDKNLALKIGVLSNDGLIENPNDPPQKWQILATSTDKAILRAGIKKGLLKTELDKKEKEIDKLPFDSERKFILSLRKINNDFLLYISGAPENILEKSLNKEKWQKQLKELTKKGMRVIGVAKRKVSSFELKNYKNLEELAYNFEFVGFLVLKDPLRDDVKEAIKLCKTAKIKPVLVTGDHKLTAKTVANEIGLNVKEENILEGKDIDKLSEKEFEKILPKISVFARVEPLHKLRIVSAWQKRGKVVAMTGDGVNDAPALKIADIGVALNSGTDVAKESSDIILLNDSFSTFVKAIEQGRVIFDNLRKAITYILADSFSSMILITFAKVFFAWPLPILPVQILYNNFVEDTLPDIAFSFEPKEEGVMKRKPNNPKKLINKEMKILIFFTGLIDEFLTLFLFWILFFRFKLPLDYVRTMIFGAVSIDTAFVIYSYKSFHKNIWEINLLSNKWLIFSSFSVLLLFSLAVYFLPFRNLLHTVPIGIGGWLILILVGILSVALIEITKYYFIKTKKYQ